MTRTGIDCGLGKTFQQEPNARGLNGREPWVGKGCRLTIVGAGRDAWVVGRRGRRKTVCARGARTAASGGRSTSIRKATKHEARYYFSQIFE